MSARMNAADQVARPFGRHYGGSAPENYERYFVPAIAAPLAGRFVERAGLREGARVLDVACGTGIVARLAAPLVGDTGAVTGVDANPGMLHVAQSVTAPDRRIAWQQGSAERLPLPDESFDVVFCQMSLQFFEDRSAALGEMRRVLVPGGRVFINVPGAAAPFFAILADALAARVDPKLGGFVRRVFSMADPVEHERLLQQAGFLDIEVSTTIYPPLRLPPPEEWLWQYVSSTPLASMMADVDDGRRAALEREIVGRWNALSDAGDDRGMILRQEIVDATGRKA